LFGFFYYLAGTLIKRPQEVGDSMRFKNEKFKIIILLLKQVIYLPAPLLGLAFSDKSRFTLPKKIML